MKIGNALLKSENYEMVLSAAQMRNFDALAKNNDILLGYRFMREAGESLARKAFEFKAKHYGVLVGKGNNGGDGLVCAEFLKRMGVNVTVFSVTQPKNFSGEAALAYNDFKKSSIEFKILESPESWQKEFETISVDFIIDALLGTGAHTPLYPLYASAVQIINSLNLPILAADTPTGFDFENACASEICLRVQETLCFGFPRLESFGKDGFASFGKCTVAKLSYSPTCIKEGDSKTYSLSFQAIRDLLPSRNDFGDKRNSGTALLIAGSENMPGAAYMAAQAALRSGIGLLTLYSSKSVMPILQTKLAEPVFHAFPNELFKSVAKYDDSKSLIFQNIISEVQHELTKNQAVGIGPGLTSSNTIQIFLKTLLPTLAIPCVLDADALNAIATLPIGAKNFLKTLRAPTILTPHIREWARLFGPLPENFRDASEIIRQTAGEIHKILVLKGAVTRIAFPDGRLFILSFPNSGMSKGGSGDVLTGILTSLLGQGVVPEQATLLGTLLHAYAGHLAKIKKGAFSMLPSDIVEFLPDAFLS